MAFQPQVDQELGIDGTTYRIAEHPAAPDMPYGQEGRQAIVYQLAAEGQEKRALKVFKAHYRLPVLVSLAAKLAPFADLPGLQVCQRTVLSAHKHAELLRQHPDLTYAVLMPWVEGPTWMEVLVEKRPLAPEQSLALARYLARVLAGMEECGLAHCDLSAPNLLLPMLVEGRGVQLVDVEQLHAAELKKPRMLPGGSPGYAHRTAPEGLWTPEADRFAGGVLLAEILGWCNGQVRDAAWGENYFDSQEMQQEADRLHTMMAALQEQWGDGVASLFERAWWSKTLQDCPTFGEWLAVLPEESAEMAEAVVAVEVGADERETGAPGPNTAVPGDDDAVPGVGGTTLESTARSLYQALKEQVTQGNWEEAERLGQALQVLWPGYRDGEDLLEQARQGEKETQHAREEIEQWAAAIRREEDRLSGEREDLEGERRQLVEALRVLKSREEDLRQRRERLSEARGQLDEAGQLLEAHRWQVARERLKSVETMIPQAVAELSAVSAGADAPGSEGELVQQQARDPRWVEHLREVRCMQHPSRESAGWLVRNDTRVMGVAFSPDGTLLASGSSDRRVRIWRIRDGELLQTWEGHTDAVWDVAFSPDGELVASGSKDGTVRLWKVAERKALCTLEGHVHGIGIHTYGVNSVAFSPVGGILASGGNDATVRLWRVPDGNPLLTLEGHLGSMRSVAFSPDGTILASGAHDATVRLWLVEDGRCCRKLKTDEGEVLSIAFLPGGEVLASGTRNGTVQLWRRADGSLLHTLKEHSSLVRSVAFSSDGGVLASGSGDGTVRLWSVTDGRLLRTLREPTDEVQCVAFSPRGAVLAVGAWAGTLRLWKAAG